MTQPFRRTVLVGADCEIEVRDESVYGYVSFSRPPVGEIGFDPFGVPNAEIFHHAVNVRRLVRAMWGYDRDGWIVLDARLLFAEVIGR